MNTEAMTTSPSLDRRLCSIAEPDFTRTHSFPRTVHGPLLELIQSPALQRQLCQFVTCVLWLAYPTDASPNLSFTWSPEHKAPAGPEWVPFYRMRGDCTVQTNLARALTALTPMPVLYLGEYPAVVILPHLAD